MDPLAEITLECPDHKIPIVDLAIALQQKFGEHIGIIGVCDGDFTIEVLGTVSDGPHLAHRISAWSNGFITGYLTAKGDKTECKQ